jgi:hypothetical protein
MKRMTRSALLGALLVLIALPAWSSATVAESRGSVQFRLPGATTWSALTVGSVLPEGAVVVSGTTGRAVIDAGNTTIVVEPLSRITIEAARIAPDDERAALSMPYGRINATVRRADNRGMDFRVFTPISTAAVRGTEFDYDGFALSVTEGDVAFTNRIGQAHSVRAGQLSRTWGTAPIQSVEQTLQESLNF